MAEIFYVPIDMAKNEILNVVLQNLGADPANPVIGQYYWNTVENELRIYTSTGWINSGLTSAGFGAFLNSLAALTGVTIADGDLLGAADVSATNAFKKITALELYTFYKTKYDLVYTPIGHVGAGGNAHPDAIAAGASGFMSGADKTKLNGIAANANNYAHPNHSGDVTSVGDGAQTIVNKAVTNAKMNDMGAYTVKANNTAAPAAPQDVTLELTLTNSATAIPRSDAVFTAIANAIGASDSMLFKGTIGTGGDITIAAFNALTVYNCGWTYIVTEAGTIKGVACNIGDWLISRVDRPSGGINADWSRAQINATGTVIGPAGAVSGNFASFNGITGALIGDSGSKASDFATAGHNHDTVYAKKFAATFGTNSVASYDITHGLGTLDVSVEVYDTTTGDTVRCGVKRVDTNTVRLTFSPVSATFPAANQFRVVIKA